MPRKYLLAVVLVLVVGRINGPVFADAVTQFKTRADLLKEFQQDHNQVPINKFFADRDNDQSSELESCRSSLKDAIDQYRDAQAQKDTELMARIMGGDGTGIDTPMMDLMEKCGPCVASVKSIAGAQFRSRGFCRGVGDVNKAKDYLTRLRNYPQGNGGFNYIVKFDGLSDNGHVDPAAVVKPAPSITTALVAVRSLADSAIGYFGDCTFRDSPASDPVRSFILQFAGSSKNFSAPRKIIDPASNKTLRFFLLKNVSGLWLADAEGNLEYETTADFGQLGEFIGALFDLKDYARSVLMDSIYHVYQFLMPLKRGNP